MKTFAAAQNGSLGRQAKDLLPAWLGCILLPLPALALWHSRDGRSVALWLFFIGCAGLVAYAFRGDMHRQVSEMPTSPERIWRDRLRLIAVALLAAFVVFSVLCLTLNDRHDFVAVFLASLILVPSFCIVPFLTLATGKPVAAAVFALFSVSAMKLLGCVVVVATYGWDADRHGYTDMPWTHPNVLVWLFWLFTGILSLSCYHLGVRKFRVSAGHVAQQVSFSQDTERS